VSPRHLTPSAEAGPPNPLYKVRITPLKKYHLVLVGRTILYALPSRECFYKVAWPSYIPEQTQPMSVVPLCTRSRAENASIKWPDRVTPLKKLQPMLVGPLYTCSRAENASIRVARLKKTAIDVVIFILYILYTYIYIYFISKCIYI
jgi:hypothetical protein